MIFLERIKHMSLLVKINPENMDEEKEEMPEMPESSVMVPDIAKEADPEESGTMGVVRRPIGSEPNDSDNPITSRREKALLTQQSTLLTQLNMFRRRK